MPEAPRPNMSEAVLFRNGELLGKKVDFQGKYSAAIERLGAAVVHKRNPAEPRDVLCMDEGLQPKSPLTVRLAGPVPLLERTSRILNQRAADGDNRIVFSRVYDHERCGALGLNLAALGEGMDINPDKAGAVLAGRFAKDLTTVSPGDHQVEYGGRLLLTRRPKDKHTGQIIWYDARRAGLDPAHMEELDPGYTLSRGVFGRHASREYAGLALGIAFGDHGLGNALTEGTPMHLVGIADNEEQMGKIADELNVIRGSRGQDAERIQVHVIAG
jgi:hypothetical protein